MLLTARTHARMLPYSIVYCLVVGTRSFRSKICSACQQQLRYAFAALLRLMPGFTGVRLLLLLTDDIAEGIATFPEAIPTLVEMLWSDGENHHSQLAAAEALMNLADNDGKQAADPLAVVMRILSPQALTLERAGPVTLNS